MTAKTKAPKKFADPPTEAHPLFCAETYAGWKASRPPLLDGFLLEMGFSEVGGTLSVLYTRRLSGWEPVVDAMATLPNGQKVVLVRNHTADEAVHAFWTAMENRLFEETGKADGEMRGRVLGLLGVK